jgi:hypothetical protein
MKYVVLMGVVLGAMTQAITSYAAQPVVTCSSDDGKYTISVTDNQDHLRARIKDGAGKEVASYDIKISQFHGYYDDADTEGGKFHLGSVDKKDWDLSATLSDGTEIEYGGDNPFDPDHNPPGLTCTPH